jgi:hypothetical protein
LTRSLLSLRHGGRCGYSQRVRALSRATSSQRRPRPPSLLPMLPSWLPPPQRASWLPPPAAS